MFATTLTLAALTAAQPAQPKFEIKDGDRIVWIGNTLVEREQRYGYWETALHAAFPDKQFTLRNLGWSGDTVFGDARGRFDFDKPDVCFKQLVGLTLELKPTVIFVSYGTNESFEGEAGLEKFEKGFNKLLDALAPAKARVVLFSPPPINPHETPAGYPDPKQRNMTLALYGEAIRKTAEKRGLIFADLHKWVRRTFEYEKIRYDREPPPSEPQQQLTENGMHLSRDGYRVVAPFFLGSLGIKPSAVDPAKLEPLRRAIVEKNQLFFYRWRPQNETYLFGFRKHEQGKNAKEVAEFDPLVAKAEEEIEKLRKELLK